MNLQVIASPGGDILWVSEAEWIRGVLAELEAAGLVTLAGQGYQGSTYAKIPQPSAPATTRSRSQPNRALPATRQQPQPPRILRCCPWRAGNSPRPSTYCKSARHKQDGKGSVTVASAPFGSRIFLAISASSQISSTHSSVNVDRRFFHGYRRSFSISSIRFRRKVPS